MCIKDRDQRALTDLPIDSHRLTPTGSGSRLSGDESQPGWCSWRREQLDRGSRVPADDLDAVGRFRVDIVLTTRHAGGVPLELAGGRRDARRDERLAVARIGIGVVVQRYGGRVRIGVRPHESDAEAGGCYGLRCQFYIVDVE